MKISSLCILFVLILSNSYSQQKAFLPVRLTCEYSSKPLGIDKKLPNISWNINTEERNWNQTAYQIIVSSNSGDLAKSNGNLWNSGKVNSHENVNVKFGGKPLPSFMNCWWKVRVWNAKGEVSKWSEPAYWKMGVLNKADWKGKWIGSDLVLKDYQAKLRALPDFDMESETDMWKRGDSLRRVIRPGDSAPAVYIRKEFKVSKKITRATAYVCGLGLHELYMNGDRVGDEYLNSAFTDYSKRVLYNTYDVTHHIKQENNALGVILGNGWYNPIVPHALRFYTADYIDPPKLLMQLHIEYEDGSVSVIATDDSWKYTTNGPIVYNDILSGETYDARKEMPGWSNSQYQDQEWRSCNSVPAPAGILKSQRLSPIRRLATAPAIKVEKTNKGFRFDIGKEICGWIKIRLKGYKGQKITIHYIGSDGHTLGRYQTHYLILNDARPIAYEPRFSYNGFRYVEVEGIDYTPPAQDVEGVLVATDLNKAGEFTCSNERFNKIQQVLINTVKNYVTHIPNDPTREKSGWTQDIQNGFDVNAYNFDVADMYIKWQYDFNDIVHEDGYVPPVVPGRFDGPTINGPWWGGMIVYNVAKLYEYYHDSAIVTDSYDAMKKYLGYLTSISKDHIVEWGLGDWMEPFSKNLGGRPTTTPIALTSTIAYYYYTCKMAEFAEMLKRNNDAVYFKGLAAKIKARYNSVFFNEQTGQYAQGSQAGQLMSLHFGLVPEGKEKLVVGKLKDFISQHNGHLATGFVATPVLLTTLSDLGLSKEAYVMTLKEDFPGWIDMIFKKGNSVMKENWQGGLVQMPSLAGPISYWFYYSLGGIRPVADSPGFGKIIIKPDLNNDLSWVKSRYQSIHGQIVSEWKKQDNIYQLHVRIPANTTALVYLPTNNVDAILENNRKLKTVSDMNVETIKDNETVVRIGSGSYSFSVNFPASKSQTN